MKTDVTSILAIPQAETWLKLQFAVPITMHVPSTLVIQRSDASLPQRTVLDLMHVTPEDVMHKPENASSPKLYVTITTSVPLTAATR